MKSLTSISPVFQLSHDEDILIYVKATVPISLNIHLPTSDGIFAVNQGV